MTGLGYDKYDSKIKLLDIVQVSLDYLEMIKYRSDIDQTSLSATSTQALDEKLACCSDGPILLSETLAC